MWKHKAKSQTACPGQCNLTVLRVVKLQTIGKTCRSYGTLKSPGSNLGHLVLTPATHKLDNSAFM